MKIGIPKEIKNNENRVGATPAGVKELIFIFQQTANSSTQCSRAAPPVSHMRQ